jgi:hypothetical protein
MNKICLNPRGRNHWKILPMPGVMKVPEGEKEQLTWADTLVKRLKFSDVKKHFFFKEQKYGYMITVIELDGLYFLIHSIRNEFKSYNNVIYINNKNLDDLVNIGRMMQANIKTIMKDYKENMLRLRDDIIKGKVRIDNEEKSIKA